MKKVIYLSRKKSGNYIISSYKEDAWTVIAECHDPSQLFEEVGKLRQISSFCKIILSEYSQAQLKCSPIEFTRERALRAFDLPASKASVSQYFSEN